jgi:hypothetical protein
MSDRARNYVKGLSLPWHVKSLLFLIADYHNIKEGCAWPGLATLAELTGRDPRNVKRTIRAAEKTGKFRFVPGVGRGNQGKFYFVELEKEVTATAFDGVKAVTKEVISSSAIRNEPLNQNKPPIVPQSETCEKHPDSGLTTWGTCWSCYEEKHSSGLKKEPQRVAG